MITIDTTQELLDLDGKAIPRTDPVVLTDGRVIDVPVTDEDGTERALTFREAAFRVLSRVDTHTDSAKYETFNLIARIMAHDRLELDTNAVKLIREASGARSPVIVHGRIVQIVETGQQSTLGAASPDPAPADV